MSRVYDHYLRDILRAIDKISSFSSGLSAEEFQNDSLRIDGVLFNLMVIGEAVKNIPEEVKNTFPEIRWRDIGRFRDRVVHHYFNLDVHIVWEIVTVHLEPLRACVVKQLEDSDSTASS